MKNNDVASINDRVEVPMLVYFGATLLVRMLSDLANFLIIGRKDMSRLS